MPDRYCQQCGAELDNETSYCPECGTAVGDDYEPETTADVTSTDGDSQDYPRGPFQSPRRAVGSLNLLGFVSFLLAIGLNAVGLPITALLHPLDIALFIYWFGVLVVGLPLWGLLHVTDNVLGFLKSD
ncbi:zinc ribbon domain-containing protein [Natrinema gari]|uniref:zinc ribbon domain-containing protein n=1 Tax=Natrinema gari TaxID=419186 RepID=UPI00135F10A5|nr:zinc ribbon domain-containing protein [Natrinema gari]